MRERSLQTRVWAVVLHWPKCRLLSEELILRCHFPLPVAMTVQPWDKSVTRSGWKLTFSSPSFCPQSLVFICACAFGLVCQTVTYMNTSPGARARTSTRAGLPQTQQPSLSSDESIRVAMTWSPQGLIQRLCCFLQLMTSKRWGKRICFRLWNLANAIIFPDRNRGSLFKVILFLSCGEDAMCRSTYLFSCGEKQPHWLHTNVHFIILKAPEIAGETWNVKFSSNPELVKSRGYKQLLCKMLCQK